MTGSLTEMVTERPTGAPPTTRLRALARTPAPRQPTRPVHRCELCGEVLPESHRHLVELPARQLACACRACALLFDRDTAGESPRRYRTVPDQRQRIAEPLDDVAWSALGVPVRLVFVVRHEDAGVAAYHPSPLGVVGTPVEPEAWELLTRRVPEARSLRPEVTALLVYRDRGEQWLVGIDECYRLTARVRQSWTGMTGGDEVWREIDRFFAELRGDAAPA
ncbi:DUF5947 family protein [Saccharomonospora sp. NB11]|jgi:hypothetical protein|uniref:DUF5947 family protein n=1 Tax=Saccharomonospora sp. NB11 TaxID=1642298 RepID=UPI0018D19186|nr:DUF5947 family protein [Saccharomonospora sp. NB11]